MKKVFHFMIVLVAGSMSLPAQPVITSQPTNQTVILGDDVVFTVAATDTGPLIYQWQLNATNIFTNGIITTVAGVYSGGFNGDGGAATNASLTHPRAVTGDAAGDFFIADGNARIRKVDTNGIITTVAGNGTAAFSGDGGEATNASLNQPYAVALDSVGDLFIADYGNARIRKVDTNGFITTVAGGGTGADGSMATNALLNGAAGVAVDAAGNLLSQFQNP